MRVLGVVRICCHCGTISLYMMDFEYEDHLQGIVTAQYSTWREVDAQGIGLHTCLLNETLLVS